MEKLKILITGATGYIGKHLVQAALAEGHEVTALVRRRLPLFDRTELTMFDYDLETPPPADAFQEIHAVFHLAAFTGETDPAFQKRECAAAKNLLEVSQQAGVEKFIYVSSQSARSDAPTLYGQTKWRIEEEVRRQGGIVVRPGLVYGGHHEEALFGTLCGLVKKVPVLPALLPAPRVQPIHVEDLCEALLTLATRTNNPEMTYCLAQPKGMPFTRFLQILAWERFRRYRWAVPVPLALLRLYVHVKKLIPVFPDIPLDRIKGLLALPHMDTEESLQALDLNLRDLAAGLRQTSGRRRILEEGNSFFRYLSGLPSGSFVLRRYVRAVEKLRGGHPLGLMPVFLRFPGWLRTIDPSRPVFVLQEQDRQDLTWHLNASVALLEASPQHAQLFTLTKSMGRVVAGARLLTPLFWESVFIVLGFVGRLPVRLGWTKYARVKDEL